MDKLGALSCSACNGNKLISNTVHWLSAGGPCCGAISRTETQAAEDRRNKRNETHRARTRNGYRRSVHAQMCLDSVWLLVRRFERNELNVNLLFSTPLLFKPKITLSNTVDIFTSCSESIPALGRVHPASVGTGSPFQAGYSDRGSKLTATSI